jgi:hypothetical protein
MWTGLESRPGILGEMSASDRLNHEMAEKKKKDKNFEEKSSS